MTGKENKHTWVWVALLFLLWLLWRWLKKQKIAATQAAAGTNANRDIDAAAAAAGPRSSSGLVSEPGSDVQGGGGTFQGYAIGDTNAASLQRSALNPDSIAMLNAVNWTDLDGNDSGWPLYDAWENGYNLTNGDMTDPNMVSATQQIHDRIMAFVAGNIPRTW